MGDDQFELTMNRSLGVVVPTVEVLVGLVGFIWRNTTKLVALAAFVTAIRQLA